MKLLDCIKAYIKGETIEYNEDDSSLVKLALEQSLQTILYPVTNNDKYLSYYVSWSLKQKKFIEVKNKVTKLLNDYSINHLYFKGSVLCDIYPDEAIRTMGDIDLYVDIKDFEKAKNILLQNGFVIDNSTEDCLHHIALLYNKIEIELHFNMLDSTSDKKWLDTFKNPFEISRKSDLYLYILDDTYHFLYCMCHFAYHLRIGAGVRYILDFYYMFKNYDIDLDTLHKLIKAFRLNTLYENIINAIFFISSENFDDNVSKKDIEFFIDYLLSYGIHGNSNNDTIQQAAHRNKGKHFINKVFLIDKKYRLSKYPKLGKHCFLYPICLIKHLFYLTTHKLGSFFKFIFGKNKNKKLYKDLGI